VNAYQPKTGERCACKPGMQRDNCPSCEGTGWRIDFATIRALGLETESDMERVFYECGCCGAYHPAAWNGDCRDDDNRFMPEDLPEGWIEVSQPT